MYDGECQVIKTFMVQTSKGDLSLLLVINVVNLKCDVFIYVKKNLERKRINISHKFLLLFLQGCFTSTLY
jgi:hypothetical protein